jgi:hypothetical protein
MQWVLSKFSERLLALNHVFKYSNMVVMSLIKSVGLELVTIILVSSVKRTGLDLSLTKFGKSFIYRRKSKGPSMDPCGTPCLILPHFEAA